MVKTKNQRTFWILGILLLLFIPFVFGAEGDYIDSFDTSVQTSSKGYGITTDSTNIWIVDQGYNEVYKYTMNGTYVDSFDTLWHGLNPIAITTDSTNLWVLDFAEEEVYKYTMNGTYVDSWDTSAHGATEYDYGIATDGTNIWIVNPISKEVYKYQMDGTYVDSWDTSAHGGGNVGIATDGTNIWILDVFDSEVYKYDMAGNYVSSWDISIQSDDSWGVTTNGTYVWIVDNVDQEVYKYEAVGVSINIDHPKPKIYSYNESLPLNYTITNTTTLDTCWFKVVNSTGSIEINNQTIPSCQNITFNVSGSDTYNLTLYVNDTTGNEGSDTVTFAVSLIAPSVVLDYPTNNLYINNGTNIYFNLTSTDLDGLDTCELWGTWNGGWHKNYTWVGPSSGVQNYTTVNLSEGSYVWNVLCNDTLGNSGWALDNFTVTVDTIFPTLSIDSITPTTGSQTFSFTNTVSDTNLDSCKYSIFNSTGGIDGLNKNVSFTCNSEISPTVTAYAIYNLTIYAIDLAGNENSSTDSFTTSPSVGNGGGGAVPVEIEKIPTIALKQITGDKIYSELERAIFYARINTFCSIQKTSQTLAIQDFSGECSVKKSDLEDIQGDMFVEGFPIEINDLILFYEKYNVRELEQVYMTLDTIKTYDLFTSVLGITNPMRVNPPRLDRPFIIMGIDGNITIEYVFVVNKKIKECSIISGEGFECEIITDNSVKMILSINDTDFFDKIFQGEMSITSDAEPENIEIKRISLFPRVYNLSYKIMGIPAIILLIILGVLILMFSVFFIMRSRMRKKLKRRKS